MGINNYLIKIGIFLAWLILGVLVNLILKKKLKKVIHNTKNKFDDKLYSISNKFVIVLSVLIGAKYSLREVAGLEKIIDILDMVVLFFLLFLLSVFISDFLIYIFGKYIKRVVEKSKNKLDDKIYEIVNRYLYLILILISLKFSSNLINLTKYNEILKLRKELFIGIDIIIVLLLSIIIIKTVNIIVDEFIGKELEKSGKNHYYTVIPLFKNITRILVWTVAISIIMKEFGYSPVSLLAGMGIIGMGVSFAAKDTIANFLSGLFILFDGPFTVGDRIKTGDLLGEVMEIGIRTTKIKTLDNLVVTIPNSNITNEEVTNYNKPNSKIKVYHSIGVAYESDMIKVKKLILECLEKTDGVLKNPKFSTYFLKFGDFSLDFEIIFWINNFKDKYDILDRLNYILNDRFKEEEIDIPFPIQDVKIIGR
ncbi:mechanosensitive ion channel family protein [Haliovirga abyssi]|uniref:Mechanosensitive ion channel family protein n=1 Tax=Haliovirga abyssi TaxID=2996794 RepID=A0AAU9DEP4_9FUSO|nr:mechanosensitive ion channel family protein [Haliovirga abyssi]BDU50837.1 hypothetical protein HLVA_14060 [Haliovirga abyssi]